MVIFIVLERVIHLLKDDPRHLEKGDQFGFERVNLMS